MEHRANPRVNADKALLLYQRGLPIAIGRLRNLSHSGLFVETGWLNIAPQQLLEVQILANDGGYPPQLRTHIAHRAQDGLGLEIHDDSDSARHLLRQLLQAAEDDAPQHYRFR